MEKWKKKKQFKEEQEKLAKEKEFQAKLEMAKAKVHCRICRKPPEGGRVAEASHLLEINDSIIEYRWEFGESRMIYWHPLGISACQSCGIPVCADCEDGGLCKWCFEEGWDTTFNNCYKYANPIIRALKSRHDRRWRK